MSPQELKKVITFLNKTKSVISSCIPVEVLIDSVDTYLPIFTNIVNSSVRNGKFSEELKSAEVTPLFIKTGPFDKVYYRTVSLLSHISNACEINIFNEISTYLESYFLVCLLVFAKIRTGNVLC